MTMEVTPEQRKEVELALKAAGLSEEDLQELSTLDLERLYLGGYISAKKLKYAQKQNLEKWLLSAASADCLWGMLSAAAQAQAQAQAAPTDLVSQARSALYRRPSAFNMSTMQEAQRKAKETLFYCYRPGFSGPPQQLPASLAHPAFGHFRDTLANKEKLPSREAQDAALQLASILPRDYPSEKTRRLAVWKVFDPFFAPFSILREKPLYSDSPYPSDGAIMPDDTTLLTVFECKNEEDSSYFQGQAYYSQFVNNTSNGDTSDGASINPALLVEICGPSVRISALFAAGPLSCGDVKAVVCEPLTPHQHFFLMPHDYQYMLTLARTLEALKACVMEIRQDKEQGAWWEQPYPIPYPLCDGLKYTDVKHVSGMQYLYTAVLHQPAEGPPELGGEAGSTSCVSATACSGGAHDAAEVVVEQPASEGGSGRAVLVKYTTHQGYGEAAHRALAQQGLAPALHSCTHLPGRLVEVVMDYLDPSEGWTSLAALPPASQQQALAAVTDAVQRMHAVVITDPATGKKGPIAHGDLRPTNIMLCRGQASEAWSNAKVLFVDFDWACVDSVGVYPAFLNHSLGRPSGVMAGNPIHQEHDIAFLEQSLRQPGSTRRAATQRKRQVPKSGSGGRQAGRTAPEPPAAVMRQPEAGRLSAATGVGVGLCPRRVSPVLRSCAPVLLRTGLRAVAQASKPRLAAASWHGAWPAC